ncbi:hypothetical protein [Veillonella magna]|uniref:hypothetical protein n=1 Tax=Veillonella magna TaxID=464322 RepID=UPI00266532CC|nr:hypothetical protein [Veillonella magna]
MRKEYVIDYTFRKGRYTGTVRIKRKTWGTLAAPDMMDPEFFETLDHRDLKDFLYEGMMLGIDDDTGLFYVRFDADGKVMKMNYEAFRKMLRKIEVVEGRYEGTDNKKLRPLRRDEENRAATEMQ